MRPKRGSRALKGVDLCAEYHGTGVSESSHPAEDAYTAPQASRVLGISDRRVRQILEAGELEGQRDASGKWWIPQRVVHQLLEERGSPRGRRSTSSSPPGASPGTEVAGEASTGADRTSDDRESVRELMVMVERTSATVWGAQRPVQSLPRGQRAPCGREGPPRARTQGGEGRTPAPGGAPGEARGGASGSLGRGQAGGVPPARAHRGGRRRSSAVVEAYIPVAGVRFRETSALLQAL